jgi:hypothetical protein
LAAPTALLLRSLSLLRLRAPLQARAPRCCARAALGLCGGARRGAARRQALGLGLSAEQTREPGAQRRGCRR